MYFLFLLPFSERERRKGKRGKRSGGILSFDLEDEEEEEKDSDKEECELSVNMKF